MDWLKVFRWGLLLFGVYIIFQILRKIFGGSWGFEDLVTALLVMNLGATFTTTFTLHSRMNKINARLSEHLGWHKGQEKKN